MVGQLREIPLQTFRREVDIGEKTEIENMGTVETEFFGFRRKIKYGQTGTIVM